MPKYLYRASYTNEGLKGLLREGASARRAAIERLFTEMGGKLEMFYFAFGEDDVYLIGEMPDNETSVAVTLAVNASGAVQVKTTVLLTPEEVDRASQKTVNYRPPGR